MSFCLIIMLSRCEKGCLLSDKQRLIDTKTVYIDSDTGSICMCSNGFYKVCPLRAAHDLPCYAAVVTITPVIRDENSLLADEAIRAVHESLRGLQHGIRSLSRKPRI